eukprot:GFUD01008803.1.p1 GENE.GFUD01008803.1~~GFUD01008803.1.p1  ORF type:complete len:1002 (+),score=221.94 GFUD01008803.1:543-3548(+)
MKKLTTSLLLKLVLIQHSYQRPSMDKRIERVFDITQGDRVNIDLAERVGVAHLAVSYPQGINCTLMKTITEEPFRICRNVSVPVCKTVQKVRLTNITEDCSTQKEYCQYNFRTQEVTQQTIICQRPTEMICDDSCTEDCSMECEKNTIVVCNTVPQTVAITEKKQRCGPDNSLQTTKICFTYPDASWVCKEPRETLDCEKEGVRLVAHEVAQPRIQCQEKEMEPLCIPENCWLKNNNTDCLTTDIPTEVRLEDQVCEICLEGRTKLRPVLVQEEDCDNFSTEEFCSEGIEESSKWSKTCSVPKFLRDEVLKRIFENTRDQFNEITDVKNQDIRESKIIRLKIPINISRQGTDSISTIESEDVFFAKQFFQNDLVRRGNNENEVLIHTNKIENKSDNKDPHAINFPFNLAEESDQSESDMRINFQFDVPSPPPHPTGVPYVYSDSASIRFTKRPTPSHLHNFNTRFAKRPTPQTVTQPSSTTHSDRFASMFKNPTNKPATDFILTDKKIQNPFVLSNNRKPKLDILNGHPRNKGKSSTNPNPHFPFQEWQDHGSVFNTQAIISERLRNTNINSVIQKDFNRVSMTADEISDHDSLSTNNSYIHSSQMINIASVVQGDLETLSSSEKHDLNRHGIQAVHLDNIHQIHGPSLGITKQVKYTNGQIDMSSLHSDFGKSHGLQESQIVNNKEDKNGSNSQRFQNSNVFDQNIIFNVLSNKSALDIQQIQSQNAGPESKYVNNQNEKSITNSQRYETVESDTTRTDGFIVTSQQLEDFLRTSVPPDLESRSPAPPITSYATEFPINPTSSEGTDFNQFKSALGINEYKSDTDLLPTSLGNESTTKHKTESLKHESRVGQEKFVEGIVSTFSDKAQASESFHDNLKEDGSVSDKVIINQKNPLVAQLTDNSTSQHSIDKDDDSQDAPQKNTNYDLEESVRTDILGQTISKPVESENNEEISQLEDVLETNLKYISPRKLDVGGSDDDLEPIFQGRFEDSDKKRKNILK